MPSEYLGTELLLPLEVMDEWIVLADDIGQLGQRPQLGPDDFVDEVVEVGVVLFRLVVQPLYGKLYLALHLIHKVHVDQHIVVLLVQPILYPNDLDDVGVLAVHLLQNCHHLNELLLGTGELAPHQVPDLEGEQVH